MKFFDKIYEFFKDCKDNDKLSQWFRDLPLEDKRSIYHNWLAFGAYHKEFRPQSNQ